MILNVVLALHVIHCPAVEATEEELGGEEGEEEKECLRTPLDDFA